MYPAVLSQTEIPIPRRKAQILALDEVRLESGPYREAMERNSAYLLSLDPNRFLHFFLVTAGLPPKADTYGGWETKVGRMLGHYLSACSMYLRATNNQEFRQRQDYIVDELAACQRANGNGYVGGVPEANRIFHEIAAGNIYISQGQHSTASMLPGTCCIKCAQVYGMLMRTAETSRHLPS